MINDKIRILFVLIFLVVTQLFSLPNNSNNYIKANIQITTNLHDIFNKHLIKKLTVDTDLNVAQDVGIMAANDLADHGWHDVIILIGPLPNTYKSLNKWSISIYKIS